MENIKEKVKCNMEILGVYKPEFDMTIDIYAGLMYQYKQFEKQLQENGYLVSERTGYSDNAKKSPLIASMESLRKDLLNYSNSLGLTPSGLKKINDKLKENKKQQSKLEMAMSSIEL